MFNPRFPHRLSVKRPRKNGQGEYILNERGDVSYETLKLSLVEYIDDQPVRNADGEFVIGELSEVVNFGYRTGSKNTTTAGEVIVADNKIACPMFLTVLQSGDILTLTDYDRTYSATVVKKITWNWGTNIWFDEIKN